MSDISYAQLQQDIFVNNLFRGKRGGFFVDVGASDGITYSNTYKFEKELGWNGICIEPETGSFGKLIAARSCKCLNICVGSQEQVGEIGFNETADPMFSSISSTSKTTKLLKPLRQVFIENNIKVVDFISIDVEGNEMNVILGIDFDNVQIKIICYEHQCNEIRKIAIEKLLTSRGFIKKADLSWDSVWVNSKFIHETVDEFADIPSECVLFMPRGGISNRIQNIISAIEYCSERNLSPYFIWGISEEVGSGKFRDFFKSPYVFTDMDKPKCERLIAKFGTTDRVSPDPSRHKALVHHWGFTCCENEDAMIDGYRRVVSGSKKGYLAPSEEIESMVEAYCKDNSVSDRVGVHMRAFEQFHGNRSCGDIDNIIARFTEEMAGQSEEKFFLCSDSSEVRQRMSNKFPSLVYRQENDKNVFSVRGDLHNAKLGLVDFYILRNCKRIIGTKISSFSHMASLMGDRHIDWVTGAREVVWATKYFGDRGDLWHG